MVTVVEDQHLVRHRAQCEGGHGSHAIPSSSASLRAQ